jgi:hypothetical protein
MGSAAGGAEHDSEADDCAGVLQSMVLAKEVPDLYEKKKHSKKL